MFMGANYSTGAVFHATPDWTAELGSGSRRIKRYPPDPDQAGLNAKGLIECPQLGTTFIDKMQLRIFFWFWYLCWAAFSAT